MVIYKNPQSKRGHGGSNKPPRCDRSTKNLALNKSFLILFSYILLKASYLHLAVAFHAGRKESVDIEFMI